MNARSGWSGQQVTTRYFVHVPVSSWERHSDPDAFQHVTTELTLTVEPAACGCHLRRDGTPVTVDGKPDEDAVVFAPEHGPARLPSKYLRTFRENGWVALACMLSPKTVGALQQTSCTGPWPDRPHDPRERLLTRGAVVARTAVEPVSLWLMRQYLQTEDIRLGHSPSFAVLDKDDGVRDVLAWHSDYPYLWGITCRIGSDRISIHDSSGFSVAVQRNVCITEFTRENGATRVKLGSQRRNAGPPPEWGTTAAYSRRAIERSMACPTMGRKQTSSRRRREASFSTMRGPDIARGSTGATRSRRPSCRP